MRRLEDEGGLGRSWKHEPEQDANQYSDGNEDDYSEWTFRVPQTIESVLQWFSCKAIVG